MEFKRGINIKSILTEIRNSDAWTVGIFGAMTSVLLYYHSFLTLVDRGLEEGGLVIIENKLSEQTIDIFQTGTTAAEVFAITSLIFLLFWLWQLYQRTMIMRIIKRENIDVIR